MGWLKNLEDEKKGLSMMGQVPAFLNFMQFGNKNDEECGMPEVWKVNGDANIPWLDKCDRVIGSIHDMPEHKDKCIILVGMSPVLNKSWEALKGADDSFVIVATNSSAKFLVDRDIIPDYVIAIDGRPGTWSLDLGEKCKDVIGLFSPYVDQEALRVWPGKIMIIPYRVKDRNLSRRIARRWGKGIASGGNSINGAFAVFALCTQAKIFLFAGNELSFKDTYYADRPSSNDEDAYFFARNIYGEEVKTFIPLYEYKIWLENGMAQLYPEYHFCNCSEGILGVDVDGSLHEFISHKPLDLAMSEIKEALEFQQKNLNVKLEEMYGQFYDHDYGNQLRGVGMWKYIIDHHKPFRKGIDVGCGRANGVEYARNEGHDVYGCDIAKSAMRCWKERGVNEFCDVCPAHNMPYENDEFDMILCSEVMEHIPEKDIIASLSEIFRIGADRFVFTIALNKEEIPMAGYIQTHICIKPPEWWFAKFREVGYTILQAGHNDDMSDITIIASKYPPKENDTYDVPLVVLGGGETDEEKWKNSYKL